ncbi:MAG: outer membrane protein [Nitrospiraceae bacterium]
MRQRAGVYSFGIVCLLFVVLSQPHMVQAEWYVAGQVGANFADRLKDIEGTGSLAGLRAPSFDLQNSLTYGGKVGYFPGHGWVGIELDAFHSTPHVKNLDNVPGIHFRVTNVGINFIVRYPGETLQPYVGFGAAAMIGHISSSPTTQSQTDVASGPVLLAGLRTFITPYVALFTEYKFTRATFQFDQAFGPVAGFVGDYQAQHVVVGVSYHF